MRHAPAPSLIYTGLSLFFILGCFDLKPSPILERDGESSDPHPCAVCTEKNCSREKTTCSGQLTCNDRQSCIDACQQQGSTTSDCEATCLQQFYQIAYFNDVTVCQAEHCKEDCEKPCGGLAYRLDGCGTCMQERCCSQATACARDADCLGYYTCVTQCTPGDWACFHGCNASADSETRTQISEFEGCFYNKCPGACGAGQSWACGQENLEIPLEKRTAELELLFADTQFRLLSGVSVAMCLWGDAGCQNPLATAESDENGIAVLHFETSATIPTRVRVVITKEGKMPVELTFSTHLTGGPVTGSGILLPSLEELSGMAAMTGTTLRPENGHVCLQFLDCTMAYARDLVVSAPEVESAAPYYIRNYLPDMAAGQTDQIGMAGFFNLPPGSVAIEAALAGQEGTPVVSETVHARAGTLVYRWIWPQ